MSHSRSPRPAASPVPPPVPPAVLLTTEEAAALLACAPKTLANDRGRRRWGVPFIRIGGIVRYERAALLVWIAERAAATAADISGAEY